MFVMRHEFVSWLRDKGYKEFTPSGLPSTITSYTSAIDKVMKLEQLDNYNEVAESILNINLLYSENGLKAKIGQESNATVINAIRAFINFLEERKLELFIKILEKNIKLRNH